jgi:hypothetical protein
VNNTESVCHACYHVRCDNCLDDLGYEEFLRRERLRGVEGEEESEEDEESSGSETEDEEEEEESEVDSEEEEEAEEIEPLPIRISYSKRKAFEDDDEDTGRESPGKRQRMPKQRNTHGDGEQDEA